MRYADELRRSFPTLEPGVDDLFLLEAHQIAQLPSRAPARELAAVLRAHPKLRAFLIARHPPIVGYLDGLRAEYELAPGADPAASELELVWELADWIVYQRAPELYDRSALHDWDLEAVTDVAALEGGTVVDAGAGTGKVAFEAAGRARRVFAVEPVARLRAFMREKATRLGVTNLFVLDGTLHHIPLPADSADVLITCRAIGWSLGEELVEIGRVVRPGGVAVHLTGGPHPPPEGDPLHDGLLAAGYTAGVYREGVAAKRRYWKQL